jgi:hypothetical protein
LVSGGAIDFNDEGDGGVLNVTGSTIEGNLAQQDGGGILIAGDADVIGTTVADNFAGRNGGGIAVWQLASDTNIYVADSWITSNQAVFGGACQAVSVRGSSRRHRCR